MGDTFESISVPRGATAKRVLASDIWPTVCDKQHKAYVGFRYTLHLQRERHLTIYFSFFKASPFYPNGSLPGDRKKKLSGSKLVPKTSSSH